VRARCVTASRLHQGRRANVCRPWVPGAVSGGGETGGQVSRECRRNWTGNTTPVLTLMYDEKYSLLTLVLLWRFDHDRFIYLLALLSISLVLVAVAVIAGRLWWRYVTELLVWLQGVCDDDASLSCWCDCRASVMTMCHWAVDVIVGRLWWWYVTEEPWFSGDSRHEGTWRPDAAYQAWC